MLSREFTLKKKSRPPLAQNLAEQSLGAVMMIHPVSTTPSYCHIKLHKSKARKNNNNQKEQREGESPPDMAIQYFKTRSMSSAFKLSDLHGCYKRPFI